jgi:hypothetical protein
MPPKKKRSANEIESVEVSPAVNTKKAKLVETKKESSIIPASSKISINEDEFGVHAMKVSEIKEKLNSRDLSTNGDKKVLSKRLIERLTKEKDPEYKPKPKGRFCKVCTTPTLMRKRSGVRGPFFGCSNYPQCSYTENRGYAMVNNVPENWRE